MAKKKSTAYKIMLVAMTMTEMEQKQALGIMRVLRKGWSVHNDRLGEKLKEAQWVSTGKSR